MQVAFKCPAGETIDVAVNEVTKKQGFISGLIGPCPSPDLVCTGLQCPGGCGAFGVCAGGTCRCHFGYTGNQCQTRMCSIDGAEPCPLDSICDAQTGFCVEDAFESSEPTSSPTSEPMTPESPVGTSILVSTTPAPTPMSSMFSQTPETDLRQPATVSPTPVQKPIVEPNEPPQPSQAPVQAIPDPPELNPGDMVIETTLRLTGEAAFQVSEEVLRSYRNGISKLAGLGVSRLSADVGYVVYGQIDSSFGIWSDAEGYAVKRAIGFIMGKPTNMVNVSIQLLDGCDMASRDQLLDKPWLSVDNTNNSIISFETSDSSLDKATRFLETLEEASRSKEAPPPATHSASILHTHHWSCLWHTLSVSEHCCQPETIYSDASTLFADGELRERLLFDLSSLLSPLKAQDVPGSILTEPPALDAAITVHVQVFGESEASVALQAIRGVEEGLTGLLLDTLEVEQGHSAMIVERPHLKTLSAENPEGNQGDTDINFLLSPCTLSTTDEEVPEADGVLTLPRWTLGVVIAAASLAVMALLFLFCWKRKKSHQSHVPSGAVRLISYPYPLKFTIASVVNSHTESYVVE